ncbi:MAG: histidinol-phosphate transaminase, partial [Candidatus Berkiella sp.]
NGSEDVLRMFIQAFGWDKHEILIPEFAFVAYKILAQGLGIKIKEVPAKHYGLDLDAMFQALSAKTRMIIFANPNNPTGTYVNHQSFVAFMNKLPQQVLVICDEAYYEYVLQKDYPNAIALQNQYPNLIVTRTFSKVYGLAGLRVGYGIADEKIIDLVNRLRQPFNVNHLAQIAAKLALQDQEFVKKSILTNEQGKKQLIEGLNKLGLRFIQGEGNFVCTQIPLAHVDVFQAMLKQGVIIRPLAPYKMDNFYRITIGTFEQNQACLKALGMILHKEKII